VAINLSTAIVIATAIVITIAKDDATATAIVTAKLFNRSMDSQKYFSTIAIGCLLYFKQSSSTIFIH
jgi:hypothetical protein